MDQIKESYLKDNVKKFTGNYDSDNNMEKYYQQKKFEFLHNLIESILIENKKISNVLDIGAGNGIFLDIVKEFNKKIITLGLDMSPEHVKTLRKKGHISIHADAEKIPLENESVDMIFLFSVIEHFYDSKVLNEIKRVLKPDGILLLETPNKYGIYEYKELVYFGVNFKDIFNSLRGKPRNYFPYHVNLYSKNEIIKTVKNYDFIIENIETRGFCLPFFGNVNYLFNIYNNNFFLKSLNYFEKKIDYLNFNIFLKCKKKI
jgi:ubiquinone/menaquinone biosynthesis C-methylase UbiE